MTNLIIMVGIPGSGKSYIANQYCISHPNSCVISSDGVRKELFGDEAILYNEKMAMEIVKKKHIDLSKLNDEQRKEKLRILSNQYLIFPRVNQKIKEALNSGKDVVYDATNLTKRNRKDYIEKFKNDYTKCIAYVVDTPLEVAKKQNDQRERKLEHAIIDRLNQNYQKVTLDEGFDEIWIQERPAILWEAIFLEKESVDKLLQQKLMITKSDLSNHPKDHHITTIYQPQKTHEDLYGTKVSIHICGIVEDHQVKNPNEKHTSEVIGAIVDEIESDDQKFNEMILQIDKLWHVTLAYSAFAVDTNYVDLKKMKSCDLTLTGYFGGFDTKKNQVIYNTVKIIK